MSTSTAPVNSTCPMTGDPVDTNLDTIDYKGQAVGFCCDECKPEWIALSDQEKDSKLAAAM